MAIAKDVPVVYSQWMAGSAANLLIKPRLCNAFREDRSPASKSRNNLALIRKIAYNIFRLHAIKEQVEWGIQRLMDYFCDHPELVGKYIFEKIESFY